jgi:hypothetical protein
MKSKIDNFAAIFRQQLTKFIGGLLILAVVWQGLTIGGDFANASPLVATSADSMSKQVSGKVEEIAGSTKQSIGKAQSAIEDKQIDAKMKIKDGMTEAKTAIDASNNRVENTAEKITDRVKNFFGK